MTRSRKDRDSPRSVAPGKTRAKPRDKPGAKPGAKARRNVGKEGREDMTRTRVSVPGGDVVAYSCGTGRETLLVVSGGPGCACDYLRDAHRHYANEGFRVVAWDQLGTGESDVPEDPSLWNIPRFVAELEAVRRALGIGSFHLLGHSWGGILALEYVLAFPQHVKRFVMSNIGPSVPLLNLGFKQCKMALGIETVKMIALHECAGTVGHPEYQAAATLLSFRHLCRMHPLPEPVVRSLGVLGPSFAAMFGPHLYHCTGSLASWDRTADLHTVGIPVLLTTGEHDYVLPEYVAIARNHFPRASLRIFANCGHMPFWEDPTAYHAEVLGFLKGHG